MHFIPSHPLGVADEIVTTMYVCMYVLFLVLGSVCGSSKWVARARRDWRRAAPWPPLGMRTAAYIHAEMSALAPYDHLLFWQVLVIYVGYSLRTRSAAVLLFLFHHCVTIWRVHNIVLGRVTLTALHIQTVSMWSCSSSGVQVVERSSSSSRYLPYQRRLFHVCM